jgi:nickel superoxide dismutase
MSHTINRKIAAVVVVSLAGFSVIVYSHCQIPCGIYDDAARLSMIAEHTGTIEKSMKQITELSAQNKPNMNQIVRWVGNKDAHADELSEIVTYYFMAQRIKPVDKADTVAYEQYLKKLTLLHEMLVYSMKAKQTTELGNVEKLRTLLAEFRAAYLGQGAHKH